MTCTWEPIRHWMLPEGHPPGLWEFQKIGGQWHRRKVHEGEKPMRIDYEMVGALAIDLRDAALIAQYDRRAQAEQDVIDVLTKIANDLGFSLTEQVPA